MIDVGSCNRKADIVDDAIINVNSLISKYEEAIFYIDRNESTHADSLVKKLNGELDDLYSLKDVLKRVSSTIRSKAREIYSKQLREKMEREKAEAEAANSHRI